MCTDVILVKEETVNKRIFEDIKKKKYTNEKLDQVINDQEDYLTNDSRNEQPTLCVCFGLGFFKVWSVKKRNKKRWYEQLSSKENCYLHMAQSFCYPSLGQTHLEAGMFFPDVYLHFRESLLNPKSFNELLLAMKFDFIVFLQQATLTFARGVLSPFVSSQTSLTVCIALILGGGNSTLHREI